MLPSKDTQAHSSSRSQSSLSSKPIRDRFKLLYKTYKELIDKVKIATKKDIPKTLLLKKIPITFMVKTQTLKTIKKIKNVLYPPDYNKIRTLNYNDDTLDLSEDYVTLREDKEKLRIIDVTNDFLEWFVEQRISTLISIVNKANKDTDYTKMLPSDVLSTIVNKLPLSSLHDVRKTSQSMKQAIPRKKLPSYLLINHPNFRKAFCKVLIKYKTTQSEKEILDEYENDYTEYKKVIEIEKEYKNDYYDVNGIFPKVIEMYFKLLNVSNMSPKYIRDLSDVFINKTEIIKYEHTSEDEDEDDLEIISDDYDIDNIILHELYKIYLVMYLCSSDKSKFDIEHLKKSCENISRVTTIVLRFNGDNIIHINNLQSHESKLTSICYLYICNYIAYVNKYKLVSENFSQFKEYWKKDDESSIGIIIPIPQKIKNMKALLKDPVGTQIYENCVKHIMTDESAVTHYTKSGKKLNLLSGFGL